MNTSEATGGEQVGTSRKANPPVHGTQETGDGHRPSELPYEGMEKSGTSSDQHAYPR